MRRLKITRTLSEPWPFVDAIRSYSLRIVPFGSAATGNDTTESDWDLFVLARDAEPISALVAKSSLDERLQLVVHTTGEWSSIRQENNAFAAEIEKGLVLWDEILAF